MKLSAFVLLVFGTILATLGGAKLPEANWGLAAIGFAILIVAMIIFRKADQDRPSVPVSESNDKEILTSLKELPEKLEAIESDLNQLSLEELHARLNDLDVNYFRPISESIPKLLRDLGAEKFAEVIGTYSSGERFLSRAWSATADKHRDEAIASFQTGVSKIKEAIALI